MSNEKIEIEAWEEEDIIVPESSSKAVSNPINSQLRVIRTNQDYNLDYLNQSIDDNIILGPDYQRRSRWSVTQKRLLIESFLLNIPIPPIFLYEREFHEYEVVDGRQRLEAIRDFFNDSFKLKNLEHFPSLNDKKFSELNPQEQRLLKRRTISATILLAESQGFDSIDIRMILFNRLNTGGVKLNSQELRNAIFSGSFNNLLDELSSNETFRKIWNIPHPKGSTSAIARLDKSLKNNPLYKTMMDCELVLRVIGINEVYLDFIDEGSMKHILDTTMKKYRNINESEKEEFKAKFIDSIQFIYEVFGNSSAKNTILNPPKRARNIYDSLVVGYWHCNKQNLKSPSVIKSNLDKTLGNETNYEKLITKGNSIENIKFRIDQAIRIFNQTL